MKKFLNIFFVVLGVIFFSLLLIGSILFIFDPLNLRSVYSNNVPTTGDVNSGEGGHPYLNESQANALRTFGIDPASLPSEITPEQQACFESKLGEERVAEIKAGDSPTATDYFKAKDCL